MPPERHLIWFPRLTAIVFMAAAPGVVMPSALVRVISDWLGLAEQP